MSALLSDFSQTGSFAKMSRWEKWRSCFFLNYLFNCEKKYFESLLHNRDLRDAFEEVSAEFRLAQAQQRLMANSSSEEGDDGVVSIICSTNSLLLFEGLSFDCLLGESGPWHVRLVRLRVQTGVREEHQQFAFYQRRHRQ